MLFKNMKKKGITSIEIVLGTLTFLLVFLAVCDFLVLSNRYLSLTDTAKELARTLSVQGGSLNVKPGSYSANYYNIEQLSNLVKKQMNGMGYEDGDYVVSIQYTKIYDDVAEESKEVDLTEIILGTKMDETYGVLKPTQKIDYLSDFTLNIKARYHWPFLKAALRLKPVVVTVSMPGTSEWRYNYDGWTEEK